MSKSEQEIIAQLDSNIPRDVISKREAGGGIKLSYLEGYYVIDRLNKVLGQGNWNKEIKELKCVFAGEVQRGGGSVFATSYTCVLVLYGKIGDRAFHIEDVGYGDGTDKVSPGKAHELAVKEAVTDAIKRCAKDLGMSMGLALYDKTQEFVEDSPKEVPVVTKTVTNAPKKVQNTPQKASNLVSKDPISEICQLVEALEYAKKLTIVEFKERYKVDKKLDSMPNEAVLAILESLKKDFPDVSVN